MPVISKSLEAVASTPGKTVHGTQCRVLLIHYRNADVVDGL